MGQRFVTQIFLLLLVGFLPACERSHNSSLATQPQNTRPTVVSLVPAATDLILGMGAGEHLVGVSNWDGPLPEIARLPRVGDYRTIDWEKITQLRPDLMIVQFGAEKMPPGLHERAAKLGVKVVNVKINRLNEVFVTLRSLGEELREVEKASDARIRLERQLDTVGGTYLDKEVRTLISRSESALAVVGGGNFIDDVLKIAGGKNVIEDGGNSYPVIDREKLLSLDPDAVLHLLPGASLQEIERAKSFWSSMTQLKAVKNGRVHILTETYLLLPGYSVGKMAELFAEKLHSKERS